MIVELDTAQLEHARACTGQSAMTDFIDWLAGALLWEAMRVAAPRPTLPSAVPPPFAAVLYLIEHDIAAARVCQCPPMWPLAYAAKHHPGCPRSAP